MHLPVRLLIKPAVFLSTLVTAPSVPLNAAQPGEAYADFTPNGAWCWFADPRAVNKNGKTYAGWVTAGGSVQVGALDNASGRVQISTLHAKYQIDDHNNPALLFLPDGRLRAFFSMHAGPDMNARVTCRPFDISEWEPVRKLDLYGGPRTRQSITYPNLAQLSAESNAVYMFWRGDHWKPTMSRSADYGVTWSPGQEIVRRTVNGGDGNRPYVKIASDGKDRIHMIFTDGHVDREPHNSVYYACYHDGAFYKADGTRIADVGQLPFEPDRADCVYDAKKSGVRAWVWDLALDAGGNPVIVYARYPAPEDHRYHYARWDGKQWRDSEMCAAGRWFPQTPPGKTEPQPYYSGGLVLDHADPSTVYLSRQVKGVFEIEKWVTPDRGGTWKSEALTAGSKHDNVRPYVVIGHDATSPTVLWMNNNGGYTHFQNYRTSIKMDRPADAARPAAVTGPAAAPGKPVVIKPAEVLSVMERVADWQLANPAKHHPIGWLQGSFYAGLVALADISANPRYLDFLMKIGDDNKWQLGPRKYVADDHCVGQTYVDLYFRGRDDRMIAPMRERFDDILANPSTTTSLKFNQPGEKDKELWSWADSLFMAPAGWVRLSAATGDPRYAEFAVANWWRASNYLYDTDENLFFRDSGYFTVAEANGSKVFWSRANGWVIAGLARVLQYLPADHPARPRFERQFRELSDRLLALQQPDGSWHSSLLDPDRFPMKENSGSGFYTFAFAWGVNNGLLDRARFEPAARRGWLSLVECVNPDGKLTRVQPVAARPALFDENSTETYGVGGFLLAGSEIYRMVTAEDTKPLTVTVTNPADFKRKGETVEIASPGKAPAVMDGTRILDSQGIGEKLLFQVDLAPGETRRYQVLDATRLPAVPEPVVKTFARFVPERMDDFAWENDRIAHRVYGPALTKKVGTVSSGVDVWVKRTRGLIVNNLYASGDYHTDRGEGLDCYNVSHGKAPTRGCGGLGIWDGKHLFVSGNFRSWKLIATGPIRSEFELAYDAWDAGGRKVSEVKRISIDAGSNFSRVESTFTTDGIEPLQVGVGIARRKGNEGVTSDLSAGWIAYWEPEQGANGNTACALVFPGGVKEFTKDEANLLAISQAKPGQPFVYYLGAGWSKSGDFPDSAAWTAYVREFAQRLKFPLVISCAKG